MSIVLSSFVFSVVMVLLGYAIWRWRAKPGDESDGEPIHGNTRLEIAWTAIPTLIVAFLGAISWIVLDDIEAKEPDRMPLTVTGQQFAWEFEYPEAGKTTREFHVPVDRQLELSLRALDVLHSFWVPEWRIKRDLVPGAPGASIDDDVVVEPDREGTFTLICTELCGLGHCHDARPGRGRVRGRVRRLAREAARHPARGRGRHWRRTHGVTSVMRSMSRMSAPEILTAMAGGNA